MQTSKSEVTAKTTHAFEHEVELAEVALRQHVEQAREMLEGLRDRAEIALHERPYLAPVAAGAVGFGVGMLVGSRLSRLLLVSAAGALMNDRIRGELTRFARDVAGKLAAPDDATMQDDVASATRE